jgi:signal peptidase I
MKKSVLREYAESLLIAFVLALFVRTFVFQAFKIPTGSMEPNLLVGDHLIVNKMIFAPSISAVERALLPSRSIRRGDVVVFKYPDDPERDFIKRVIGLPGDRVELRQKRVFVNDQPLQEPYAHHADGPPGSGQARSEDVREAYGPVTVPDGQYFMMGDNRDNSQDSRFWGYLPHHYIKGQALFIYFSFAEAGALSSFFSDVRWSRIGGRVR